MQKIIHLHKKSGAITFFFLNFAQNYITNLFNKDVL